jgi:DNA-binding transcriptional ArsR family regulator
MIDNSYERFFGTLGNENRQAIIKFLSDSGENNVNKIAAGVGLEQSLVSHHMKHLLTCGFVHINPDGKERVYSLNHETIEPLFKLIDTHVKNYCSKVCKDCKEGSGHAHK